MNKRSLTVLLALLCAVLCACHPAEASDSSAAYPSLQQPTEPSDTRQTLSALRAALPEQTAQVIAGSYPNLRFAEDFTALVPQTSKLCSFTLTQQADPSPEDCIARFQELLPTVFGSDARMDTLCHVCASSLPCTDGAYPDNYPRYADHAAELLGGGTDFTLLFADTEAGHLAVSRSGRVHAYNGGKTAARSQTHSGAVGMYFPGTEYPVTAVYNRAETADAYALADRTVPVGEAAEAAEAWIADGGFGGGSALTPSVAQVQVLDLGGGIHGYSFTVGNAFEGVPIDVYETTGTVTFTKSSAENDREYERVPGSAFMLESTGLDIVLGYNSAYALSVTAEHDSVLPLTEAVQLFSDAFPESQALAVSRAQLLYAVYRSGGQNHLLHSEIIWKFTAQCADDTLSYVVYIDALDGSCHYYAV